MRHHPSAVSTDSTIQSRRKHSSEQSGKAQLGRPFQVTALFLSLVILIAVIVGACGASSSKTTGSATTAMAYATTAAGKYNDESAIDGFSGTNTKPGAAVTQSTNLATMATKIIRNANLDIEVEDVIKAYDSLLQHAAVNGGYEASRKVTVSGTYTVLEAKIKIKPEFLDDLLTFAGTTGKIINVQTTSQDITESYYDTKTRQETMESMLQKYKEFLLNAKTVQEALSVQSEINRLTTEIEALKGKLRYYDTMVAESTVTILIRQTNDPVKIKKEIKWNALTWEDMGYLMQRGLMAVVNTLTGILQWFLIALVAASPVLIIAAIVLFILIRRRRRNRLNDKKQDDNTTPPTPM